jgi:hypothetical protein
MLYEGEEGLLDIPRSKGQPYNLYGYQPDKQVWRKLY